MLRQLLGLGILLAFLVGFSQGECNACSVESNAACVSTNQYQNCTDNIPTGPIYTCPNNTNCTGSAERCTSNETLFSCNDCNNTPSQILGSCGANYVCDYNNPNICGSPSAGSQATCPGDTTETGLDSTGLTPTAYCSLVQQRGRFPYGIDLNTTCKQQPAISASETKVSCVSQNEFQLCSSDGVAIGGLYTCPSGYHCVESTPFCSSSSVEPACPGCNKCSSDNRFACTSRNTFAFTSMGKLRLGFGVQRVQPQFCGNPAMFSVTCSDSGSGTCGSTTITNATDYCRSMKKAGRFPYGRVTSTTCRQYVNCYTAAGIYYGNVYTCPGHTYFDSTSSLCTTQTQARCSDTVSCLTLNDRLLL
ncbi:hypothetical protein M5D96_006867 [Drosophila gunungcola]|uniref:Chitin-binding type-2 domain-containing protein n=1 Tax=Drosophila gunungcola TaxID=103775 RepID=A0A9Q0BRB1_9MUSC|nr:hypothetical protein M5D96_006867 [Drosophila gunungcola]